MTLQQESMIFAIAALDTQFSWSVTSKELVTMQGNAGAGTSPLLGGQDVEGWCELHDSCDWLAHMVCTRNSQLEVLNGQ